MYVNVEVGQSAREDVAAAMRAILSALARGARHALEDSFVAEVWPGILDDAGPNDAFGGDPCPLVASRRQAAGADDRRDRRADRRHPAGGVAATARRLPGTPAPLSPGRDPVRSARRARLPHPLVRRKRHHRRGQRLQHPSRIPAPGGLLARRGRVPAGTAHRGDRPGVHRRGATRHMGVEPGSAVAGQRPGLRSLLQEQGRARPQPVDHPRRHPGGPRAVDPAPRDASGPTHRQVARGARTPRGRTAAERCGRHRLDCRR